MDEISQILLDEIRALRKKVDCIQGDLIRLKATSGLWGAISGALAALGAFMIGPFHK